MFEFKPENHLIDLKGKPYMQVQWRVVWFRSEHPDWHINTTIDFRDKYILAKAIILDPAGKAVAHGHALESFGEKAVECAETGAVGRALAFLGYGTSFALDIQEPADQPVDAPIDNPSDVITPVPGQTGTATHNMLYTAKNHAPGADNSKLETAKKVFKAKPYGGPAEDYKMPFGMDKGKKLKEIPEANVKSTVDWARNKDKVKFKDLIEACEKYLGNLEASVDPGIPDGPPLESYQPDEVPF
jgi:hypothetical protein